MHKLSAYCKQKHVKVGLILLLFTTLLTSINSILNLGRIGVSSTEAWIYGIVTAIGYAFAFALVIYIITYFIPSTFTRSYRCPAIIYMAVVIVWQIFLVIDGIVLGIYQFHINGKLFNLFFKSGSDVFVFEYKMILGLVLLLISTCVLPYVLLYICLNKKSLETITGSVLLKLLGLVIAIFIGSNLFYLYAKLETNRNIVEASKSVFGFPFAPLNAVVAQFSYLQLSDTDKALFTSTVPHMKYPLKPIEIDKEKVKDYNIVYIVIDSWNIRTFDNDVSPNIYDFSKQSDIFKNHFSSSNATIGGIFGMFYSMPYLYNSYAEQSHIYPVLFDQMKKVGYDCKFFSSAELVLPHSAFGQFTEAEIIATEGQTAFDRDNRITENFCSFLKERDKNKPFYSFLFYDLAHAISIPAEHRTKFTPSWSEPNYLLLSNDLDPTPFFNLYKNCIFYIDQLVGDVIKNLEQQEILENTILVITGDHGQEFNESKTNSWGHFSNYSKWQIQVPLIVHIPRQTEGRVFEHTTTHYDLTPTIMTECLGVVSDSKDYAVGHSLYEKTERYPFWSGDFTIRTSLVFPDVLFTAEHGSALLYITDRNLNPISDDILDKYEKQIIKAGEQKMQFVE